MNKEGREGPSGTKTVIGSEQRDGSGTECSSLGRKCPKTIEVKKTGKSRYPPLSVYDNE